MVGAELVAFVWRFRNSETRDWLLIDAWGWGWGWGWAERPWLAGPGRWWWCRTRFSFLGSGLVWMPSSRPLAAARASTSWAVSVTSGSGCKEGSSGGWRGSQNRSQGKGEISLQLRLNERESVCVCVCVCVSDLYDFIKVCVCVCVCVWL